MVAQAAGRHREREDGEEVGAGDDPHHTDRRVGVLPEEDRQVRVDRTGPKPHDEVGEADEQELPPGGDWRAGGPAVRVVFR